MGIFIIFFFKNKYKMKFAIALLLASSEAINIKITPLAGQTPLAGHYPADNSCVNVRKDTGIEENCNAVGNSAWEPAAPMEDPLDLGWVAGFEGLFWYSKVDCKDGCATIGKPDFVTTTT